MDCQKFKSSLGYTVSSLLQQINKETYLDVILETTRQGKGEKKDKMNFKSKIKILALVDARHKIRK